MQANIGAYIPFKVIYITLRFTSKRKNFTPRNIFHKKYEHTCTYLLNVNLLCSLIFYKIVSFWNENINPTVFYFLKLNVKLWLAFFIQVRNNWVWRRAEFIHLPVATGRWLTKLVFSTQREIYSVKMFGLFNITN